MDFMLQSVEVFTGQGKLFSAEKCSGEERERCYRSSRPPFVSSNTSLEVSL